MSVSENYPKAQLQTGQPAKALFYYFAINLILWFFLRAINVESLSLRLAIPLVVTLGIIVPLHVRWHRGQQNRRP